MPTTDQLQGEINGINAALGRHYGYILQADQQIAGLQQQAATLQQRCSRLETQVRDLQDKLAKVKKG